MPSRKTKGKEKPKYRRVFNLAEYATGGLANKILNLPILAVEKSSTKYRLKPAPESDPESEPDYAYHAELETEFESGEEFDLVSDVDERETKVAHRRRVSRDLSTETEEECITVSETTRSTTQPRRKSLDAGSKKVRFKESTSRSALKKSTDNASRISGESKFCAEVLSDAMELWQRRAAQRDAGDYYPSGQYKPKYRVEQTITEFDPESEAESEKSESEAEIPPKAKKPPTTRSKGRKSRNSSRSASRSASDTEASASESEKPTDESEDADKKAKKTKKTKNVDRSKEAEKSRETEKAGEAKKASQGDKSKRKKGKESKNFKASKDTPDAKADSSGVEDNSDADNSSDTDDASTDDALTTSDNDQHVKPQKNLNNKGKKGAKKKNKKQDNDYSDGREPAAEKPFKKGKQYNDASQPVYPNPNLVHNYPPSPQPYYPRGWPHGGPRNAGYVEPVRAHVVQTERVDGGFPDPATNAFYDGHNNLLRVYPDPPYSHPDMLYQGQGSRHRPYPQPLAFRPAHAPPVQDGYYQGYPTYSGSQGYGHVPVTRGMTPQQLPAQPIPPQFMMPPGMPYQGMPPHGVPVQGAPLPQAWNGMYPPPGYYPPYHAKEAAPASGSGKEKEKPEPNNVGPGSTGSANPYRVQSQFSTYGEKRDRSKDSRKSPTKSNDDGWPKTSSHRSSPREKNGDGPTMGGPPLDTWGVTDAPDPWGVTKSPDTWAATNASDTWGGSKDQGQDSRSTKHRNHWSAAEDWPSTKPASSPNATQNASPPRDTSMKEVSPPPAENNVMPGTWVNTPQTSCPEWGDHTAAADIEIQRQNDPQVW